MPASSAAQVRRRNAVTYRGEGTRTVVLVHGLGCDQRIWDPLVARLAVDHRVVTFDAMGVGHSDREQDDPVKYRTIEGYARDLVEVAHTVERGPPVVVGHSLGGTFAVHAAILDPTFASRLVLLMTSPRYLDDPPYRGGMTAGDVHDVLDTMDRNYVGWATGFADVVAPQGDAARTMRDALTTSDPRTTRHLAELVFESDLRPLLPRVSIETLVIESADDPIVPPEASAALRSIPGARSVSLDAPGHCPHVSHPALVEAALRPFLAER